MRRQRVLILAILLAIAVSAALAACGGAVPDTGVPPARSLTPGVCANPTAGTTDARLSGSLARVVPVTTLPPGVTVGQVRVVVESGSYAPDSTIFAWAGNGLSQCIATTDHHSDCSIVVLERQVGGVWQTQADCQTATPSRTVALESMQAAFIRLTPPAAGAQPGAWPTGTYRVAFTYWPDESGTGQPIEVDSETFTIA